MAQDYAPEGEDLYADAGPVAPPSETAEPPVPDAESAEAEGEGRTAILPKDVFMGKPLEPGTRCEIEIVKVHDGEVEVKYIPHGEEEEPVEEEMPIEEEVAAGPPPMPPGGGADEMAALMA